MLRFQPISDGTTERHVEQVSFRYFTQLLSL